ncbi:MAG: homoserine kinase [Polaribacter sp. BACL8 MAG-120531-bin13]|jgi:homoserine kinase|nr:MAG: homoserine kinase [Polaribacter sp. BACL8 MAG-120531-bin13]KRP14094.1 MAG: homoserine kinase [Polaribacter sp. BACL8 MAG-120419-bin8]MBT5921487.1 homoserine kinase [Flavobacteriaceae bacterium]NQV63557.1 homoserine kinase [Cryomorphaceae bacterium]MDA8932365.1 homoserine kinase [Flavobacteriaceae bacterium]|tara:strand:- start:7143 stop:8063 length:921 start_codon:yes stop_codon:yes gene_type:complete
MKSIRVFCPGTIANVSCGFDVLGLSLAGVGEYMTVTQTPTKGITISEITGQDLPLETAKNVAGVAGLALLEALGSEAGFDIKIEKKIKAGSGIGSSAASSAGAVWAINHLLGNPYTTIELIPFAMEGERLASGVAHADNVAPALLGGFTLVRSTDPLDVVSLPSPRELYATVIHPQIEIKTADSRRILKSSLSLKDAITQWGNVGGLVAGLYREDYELIGRSLQDVVIEPVRSILIPGFDEIKAAALNAGALGCGISGSGPSVFALSKGADKAHEVAQQLKEVYTPMGIPFDIHISNINEKGVYPT